VTGESLWLNEGASGLVGRLIFVQDKGVRALRAFRTLKTLAGSAVKAVRKVQAPFGGRR